MSDKVTSDVSLVAPYDLVDVVFFEVSAKRLDIPTEPVQSMEIPLVAQIGQPDDNSEIVVRIALDLTGHQAEFRVDVAARYRLETPTFLTDTERISFAESGPMLTLLPFLREALMSSASRLRVDVPVIPLGRIQVPVNGSEPAGQS